MIEKIQLLFIAFFSISMFYTNCEKNNEVISNRSWSKIIKEMEVTLTKNQPDSNKITQIKYIFEKYEINRNDYRWFYEEFVEHNPLESSVLLQELVGFVSADLDTIAQENLKKMKNFNSNIGDSRKK
jgi:hypothetical protein